MGMNGYVGLCMAVYGYVWLGMARYGCVGPCMAVYGYGCLCMSVYSYVCPYRPVRINYSGHFMQHTWITYPAVSHSGRRRRRRSPKSCLGGVSLLF